MNRWSPARWTSHRRSAAGRVERVALEDVRAVAARQQRRERLQEVVEAAMGDERAQQRRAALAQHGAHAALRGEVLERRGRRRPAGRKPVDGDVGAAPREVEVGLRVDLDPRPRLGEERDLDGHVATARDRRHERLGGEAALGPPLALVVVEQVGVALGAQRAGADEDRVHRRPQLTQQRGVGRVAEAGRPPFDRGPPVRRGDHRRCHLRPAVWPPGVEPERGDDVGRRASGAGGAEGDEGRAHAAQYAGGLSGS